VRRVEVGAQFRHSALSFAGACNFRAQFFGELVGVHGVLVRLFAEFVSGKMISLAVSRGGRGVGMGSKVMEFCGSIVRALWHDLSPASWMLPTPLLFRLGMVCVLFR
jgi:hypothetical protein